MQQFEFLSYDKLSPEERTQDMQDPTFLRLLGQLRAAAQPAKVGKDLMDPFEVFGFYPSLDLMTASQHIPDVLGLFGFMPGIECIAAVQKAQQLGARLALIDAPLKLQEGWVRAMVQQFQLQVSISSLQTFLSIFNLSSILGNFEHLHFFQKFKGNQATLRNVYFCGTSSMFQGFKGKNSKAIEPRCECVM